MKYVGQRDRSFHKRYKEHVHDFKYNIRKSSFATHLLDNNHSMGPIYEIMDILYTTGKCKFMDTVERFHIYSETRNTNCSDHFAQRHYHVSTMPDLYISL
jgi:hypothetical protein